MAVSVSWSSGVLSVDGPVLLFEGDYVLDNTGHATYDVDLTGDQFLMTTRGDPGGGGRGNTVGVSTSSRTGRMS